MIEQIGRYRIVRELGRGGFGQVYLAQDPVMDRQVAIKVLTELGDPSVIARFRTEAIAAGNLHHRNIVTIYDFGEEQQRHFLVMEFLDGRDLQKIMSSAEPLALWQKVDIMNQIAEGLYCAHQSGVVHRDVKPANVIVLRDGTVKIVDFGIARLTERDATRLTRSGFLLGTVLYMAPEHLSNGVVDALSDIWSYGVMYYELLTRRHPFPAHDTASQIYHIMNNDPERVSAVAPECPESLDRIVAKLLAKQREFRYQSFAELQYDTVPLLRDLKRQQASNLVNQAAGLVEGGRFDEAQSMVRSILDLDPGNSDGARLRERVTQALKRQTIRPKVDQLLETVENQTAARNYVAAIQTLEKARALDPGDPSLSKRLDILKSRHQQTEAAQRCLIEARQQLELQNLTEAFKQVSTAVNLDPGAPEASQLLDSIQREMAERDRERNVMRAINRAKGLLVMELFDEALEILRKAAEESPGSERIEDLLRQTQRQKAERDARERIAAAVAQARALVKRRAFAEAITLLEGLHREFPADGELAGLLTFARDEKTNEERAAAIDRLIRQARALTQNRDFDAALRAVEEGLTTYPGDESLMRLMQAVLSAKAEDEKRRAFDDGLSRARRLREQGSLSEALNLTGTLSRDRPADAEVAKLREEIQRDQRRMEDQRAAAEREATAQREIAAAIAEATRKADAGDWTGALATAEEAHRRYPNAPKLKEAADYMRRKKSEVESQMYVDSACGEIQRSLNAGQLDAARDRLARARRECRPDPKFDALETQMQQAVQRQESQRTAQRAAEERKQKYDSTRFEAARLLRERQFDPAIRLLESLLPEHPADPLLQEDLRSAREARDRSVRGETIAKARAAAEELLRNKDFAKAVWVLEELQRRFPDEFSIADEIKSARAAKEDYERKQASAAGRAEAERLLAARDFAGAVNLYQTLQQQFPSDPLLRDALQSALAAQEQRRRQQEAAEGRAEAQRLMRDRVPEAIRLLHSLVEKFPEDLALADMLRAAEDTQRNRALIAGRAEAEKLAADLNYDAAIRRYEELLKQYPGDRTLVDGLAAARNQQSADARKQTYSRGRAEAEKLAAERSFDAAAERYRTLLDQFPNDTALLDGLASVTSARDAAERRRVYNLGRKAVDDALRSKNFAEALQLLESLRKRCPDEPAVVDDLKMVLGLKQDYERKQAYAEESAEAERLLAARDFAGAIAKYQALEKQFPNDPFLQDSLKSAIAAGEQYRRKREAAQGRGEVERLMRERKLGEAVALLESLVQKFPEDLALADDLRAAIEFRNQTQRTQALNTGRMAAERLVAERSYEAAIRRYEDLLKEYPGDRILMEGLNAVKEARASEERRQAYQHGRAEAEKLAGARSYDAAIKRYRALLTDFPGDRALEEGLAAVTAAKSGAERKQVYDQGRAEADRLGREFKFDAAIRKLDELLSQFPHDRVLEEDRQSLAAAQKLREERLRIDKQLDALEKLYRKGDASGVREGAARLLAESENPRARELLEWAEGIQKRQTQAIPRPDLEPAPPPPKSRLVPIVAIAGAAVLAIGGFFFWNSHRPPADTTTNSNPPVVPAAPLSVDPGQVDFGAWTQGGPAPAARVVKVSGPAWKLSTSDAWVIAKPATADPTHTAEISVDTGKLAPGEYSGLLLVQAGSDTQHVVVKIAVQPEPKPADTGRGNPPVVQQPPPKVVPPKNDTNTNTPLRPQPDPPVTEQAVDCKSSKWFGVDRGRLRWSGDLPPGGFVLLGRELKTINGAGGTWSGQAIPGCEINVTKLTPEISIEPPSAGDHFSRLRVRNTSPNALSSFSLSWEVK